MAVLALAVARLRRHAFPAVASACGRDWSARLGERGFQALYSLVALLTFGGMIWVYGGDRPTSRRCGTLGEAGWIAATMLMWFGAVLFVGSLRRQSGACRARGRVERAPAASCDHPPRDDVGLRAVGGRAFGADRRRPRRWCSTARSCSWRWSARLVQDRKKRRLMGDRWHEWAAQTASCRLGGA